MYRDKHPRWKGGRRTNERGYVLLLMPDHPRARGNPPRMVYEHIVVYEEYHKCRILPWACVHHINGKKDDNRPENLVLMGKGHHTRLHVGGITFTRIEKNRRCSKCGSEVTYFRYDRERERNYAQWYTVEGHKVCARCRWNRGLLTDWRSDILSKSM